MGKRKTVISERERKKQQQRAAKKRRQAHDPEKWAEKKRRKQQSQKAYKEGKFPGINTKCTLKSFQIPSPEHCEGCELTCSYNTNR